MIVGIVVHCYLECVFDAGVTLWEMFTYGKRPYENLHAREIPEALEKGERLLQPEVCSIDVYMTLIKCKVISVALNLIIMKNVLYLTWLQCFKVFLVDNKIKNRNYLTNCVDVKGKC